MKIYPNTSNIIVTNKVNEKTDIALSYIDTAKLDYRINTVINKEYKNKIKQEVLPYEKINKSIICLFDKFNDKVDSIELSKNIKRENNDYIYLPYDSMIFNPKIFEYNVTAKKNIIYNSRMQYDIKIAVESDSLANTLMPIFGDAQIRNLAPSNILINNGSKSYNDFITSNLKNKDILFMISNDINIDKDKKDNAFKYKTNIFNIVSRMAAINKEDIDENNISIDLDNINLLIAENKSKYMINKPNIFNEVSIETNMYFNIPRSKKDNIKYHNIFNSNVVPILIEEHEGEGFIIYAINEIIDNISKYSKLIYEVMFYIYSKGYVKTEQYREWITDKIPDYIVVNNKITKKERFISQLELHKMFGLNQYEISAYKVEIDKELYPYVKFIGLNDNYLLFEKDISGDNSKYQDPENKNNLLSIYTSRQNIVYFNNFLYKIDDSLEENMQIERLDNKVRVTIKPYRHSSNGIYIKTLTAIDLPLSYEDDNNNIIQINNIDYYIICKQNESASYIEYIDVSKYKNSDGLILATIQIRLDETKTINYDMRQRGGGLPLEAKDNYNCFDIGHIYGRPYRKGGSIIITLPKRLEPHKDMIMNTIKQYCIAEEYPIIIFKED